MADGGLRNFIEKPVISLPSLILSQRCFLPPSPTSFKIYPSLHWPHSCFNTFPMRGSPVRYDLFYSLSMHGTARFTIHSCHDRRCPVRAEELVRHGYSSPIGPTGPGRACSGRFRNTRLPPRRTYATPTRLH